MYSPYSSKRSDSEERFVHVQTSLHEKHRTQQSVTVHSARSSSFVASRARTVYVTSRRRQRKSRVAGSYSLSLHLHQQHTRHLPAPLSSFTPTSFFLSLLLSEREISRNLSEAVLETPERRYPPKAQHGYNCNLHQVYRRKPAVRRARKVSDRTAAFVWRVTLTALCLIVLPVSSSVC